MPGLLKGFVDLHVHAGPSVVNREIDAWELSEKASGYGYRGLVVKDHYFPTMMSAALVNAHAGTGAVPIYSQIVLNNSVGGVNVKAVEIACNMGAKIVCMPTVSAENHQLKYAGKNFVGGGQQAVREQPICILENGMLKKPVASVLDYLAGKPEVILATGHLSPEEIDVLLPVAVKKGIQRILVNHPFVLVDAGIAQMCDWAGMGAYIELNACDIDPISHYADGDLHLIWQILERVPENRIIIDSDYGQAGNIDPFEGMLHFVGFLKEQYGLSDEAIEFMGKINPGWLLGLNGKEAMS